MAHSVSRARQQSTRKRHGQAISLPNQNYEQQQEDGTHGLVQK